MSGSRTVRAVTPQTPEDENSIIQPNPKVLAISQAVTDQIRMARFRGNPMVMLYEPYPHWSPLDFDTFKTFAYPIVQAVTRSNMGDAWDYLSHTAEDLTPYDNYILFGRGPVDVDDEGNPVSGDHPDAVCTVWDMDDLTISTGFPKDQCVWRSPYARIPTKPMFSKNEYPEHIPFIMDLACGDEDMYHDIMLSMAPIVMRQKPDGVVWWVGDGANGKSTLMDALYDIFPDQLTGMNIAQITEGKDLPSLNGYLANIVRESSEGRIDDTQNYKSLGTHENFKVHKFHSQSPTTVNANIHHIFSANQVPVFNDKGHSARRRTHIIPFNAHFESDPLFKKKTFTPEFYGRLISEMCKYANIIARDGYRFKWKSTVTTGTKTEYDEDVNSAEAYMRSIVRQGVVAFDNFGPLNVDYESWCIDNGFTKLGPKMLRETAKRAGFSRGSMRVEDKIEKPYLLGNANSGELQKLSMGRPGLYTMLGAPIPDPEPVKVPPFHEPAEKPEPAPTPNFTGSKLKGEW